MKYVMLLSLVALAGMAHAQRPSRADSTNTIQLDSALNQPKGPVVEIESMATRFDPRKALLYSAIFPGSGQIYNRKYWKAPLVWGGFGFLIYVTGFYADAHERYKGELFGLLSDANFQPPSNLNEEQLRRIVDITRRQRDFFIVLNGMWYLLQLVDAHVDAHLKEFDLNPKLKISFRPHLDAHPMTGRTTGMALVFRF